MRNFSLFVAFYYFRPCQYFFQFIKDQNLEEIYGSGNKRIVIHCVKSVQIRSFFWSVLFHIRTEYGDLLRKSPYLVRIRENTDQKKLRIWTLFTELFLSKKPTVVQIFHQILNRGYLLFRIPSLTAKYSLRS